MHELDPFLTGSDVIRTRAFLGLAGGSETEERWSYCGVASAKTRQNAKTPDTPPRRTGPDVEPPLLGATKLFGSVLDIRYPAFICAPDAARSAASTAALSVTHPKIPPCALTICSATR